MMTIDNLPTQLPRDASDYFGGALCPVLQNYIEQGLQDEAIQGSAVTISGVVVPRFSGRLQPLLDRISSKKILVLGAGLVSRPTIEYLAQFTEYSITIAAPGFEGLRLDPERENVHLLQASIREGDLGKVEAAIADSHLIISLLPATMHPMILESVLRHRRHLVTASYVSPTMESYDEKVRAAGLTWLNEVGLDPGLDHMSALRLIHSEQQKGYHISSFISWCGGLPAPEAADNPLGYKFSWSPRGALLATQNAARFLQDGQLVEIPGDHLLQSARPVRLHPAFAFEGLPNRDSTRYIKLYGLEGIQTMFRGTLRFAGFCEFMEGLRRLDWLDPLKACNPHQNWAMAMKETVGVDHHQMGDVDWMTAVSVRLPDWSKDRVARLVHGLSALGLLSTSEPFDVRSSRLDALCTLLERKLCFGLGERDMCFMHHQLIISNAARKEILTSTLCLYGNSKNSAMSLTVGLPVAVAARLILEGVIVERGIIVPTSQPIYEPILAELERMGIDFVEQRLPIFNN